MVDQICEEGVPAYTDTVATEKSNHQTVVTNFAKSSKRINTYLREMSDAKNYTLQTETLYLLRRYKKDFDKQIRNFKQLAMKVT